MPSWVASIQVSVIKAGSKQTRYLNINPAGNQATQELRADPGSGKTNAR